MEIAGSVKSVLTEPEDENVFDIQQGVAIVLFVKKERKRKGMRGLLSRCLWIEGR